MLLLPSYIILSTPTKNVSAPLCFHSFLTSAVLATRLSQCFCLLHTVSASKTLFQLHHIRANWLFDNQVTCLLRKFGGKGNTEITHQACSLPPPPPAGLGLDTSSTWHQKACVWMPGNSKGVSVDMLVYFLAWPQLFFSVGWDTVGISHSLIL
jgi:hypothetical protein